MTERNTERAEYVGLVAEPVSASMLSRSMPVAASGPSVIARFHAHNRRVRDHVVATTPRLRTVVEAVVWCLVLFKSPRDALSEARYSESHEFMPLGLVLTLLALSPACLPLHAVRFFWHVLMIGASAVLFGTSAPERESSNPDTKERGQ